MLIATIKVISNEIDMRVYLVNKFRTYFNNILQFHYTDNTEQIDISIFGNLLNEKNIKALFTEPQYSSKIADTIAKETGASIYTLDPIVTGDANEDAYDDYIVKMQENLNTLKEALKW